MDIDLLGDSPIVEKPAQNDEEFVFAPVQNQVKVTENQNVEQNIRKQSDQVWVQSIQEQKEEEENWEVAQVSQIKTNTEVQTLNQNQEKIESVLPTQIQNQVITQKTEEISQKQVPNVLQTVGPAQIQLNVVNQTQNLNKQLQINQNVQVQNVSKPVQDDDDDFGDYQQSSVPPTQIPQSQQTQTVVEQVKWLDSHQHTGEDHVLKDLQSFVDKLPDYSYLLKLAFIE